MHDVQALCDRFGLSVKQVRDRLTALAPSLTEHILQGKRGAKVLTDSGLAIFDRLVQLEKGGLSVSAAAEKIKNERLEADNSASSTSVGERGVSGDSKVVELLTQQNEDLREERDRLLKLLEDQSAQLRAVLPRAGEVNGGDPVKTLSRWDGFKLLFFGAKSATR